METSKLIKVNRKEYSNQISMVFSGHKNGSGMQKTGETPFFNYNAINDLLGTSSWTVQYRKINGDIYIIHEFNSWIGLLYEVIDRNYNVIGYLIDEPYKKDIQKYKLEELPKQDWFKGDIFII